MIKTKILWLFITLLFSYVAHAANDKNALESFASESRGLSNDYLKRLSVLRQAEIKTIGHGYSIETCSISGPILAMEFSRTFNASFRRVSLNPRNLIRASADAWEQKVLLHFGNELKSRKQKDNIEYAEQLNEPAASYLRYMKPILVKKKCLQCHGSTQLIPEVKSTLERLYPHDQATGYQIGEMIGAISIKKRLK